MKATVKTYQVGRWRWVGEYVERTPGGLPNPFVLTFYGMTRDRVIRKAVGYIRREERMAASTETTELPA